MGAHAQASVKEHGETSGTWTPFEVCVACMVGRRTRANGRAQPRQLRS